jgi:NAD(P)H-hydrate epimerase
MITAERMAAVDANAAALGVPRKQLMESSGNAVAREVRAVAAPGDRVAVVAGRGNNGGDAFVAARFLDGFDVSVHLLGRPETITTDIARENWAALSAAEIPTERWRDSTAVELPAADVVVDAMLGTGVTGALREPAATAAAEVSDASATVVSVDVPSGVDANTGDAAGTAVDADRVVTFHDEKPGLASLDAAVTVADIGIPEAAETLVGPGDRGFLERDPTAHKGDFGRVLVVGGGPYTGAPALSARAALRAGADLAYVACPANVADAVQGYDESVIVRPLAGDLVGSAHLDQLLDYATEMDAVLVGPGLGDADGTREAVRSFLAAYDGRAVVDADALSVVPDVETDADLLCTPHRGELRGMGGPNVADARDAAEAVAAFAADLEATLLVKGPQDLLTDGERTRRNRTGNPGMTVGGTGDVLAGVAAALSCTQPLHRAGAVAAYANGLAGDRVVDASGYGMLPTDLLDELPDVLWGDRDV